MTNEKVGGIRPDEVLPPDGSSLQGRGFVRDAVLLVPNLAKLVSRLLRDPRVPRRAKFALGLAAVYVASPIDLIPDKLPVIGWIDDLVVLMFALDSLIDRAGPDVVSELWDGPGDLLTLVRDVVGLSRHIVPNRLGVMIDRLSG